MGDLSNVLTGLNGVIARSSNVVCDVPDNIKMPDFEYGEHVVCVWHDRQENQLSWFLGTVVAGGREGEHINVSYMQHTDKKGTQWLFPGGRNSEN